MTPDVTVVIAAYNAMPHIVECIESVLRQTMDRERIEIVAVDDGSTDGTGEVLDDLAAENPTLHVIHQPNSGGAARPRNRALDAATGRYVLVLDADDYLGEEALERMIAVADEQATDVILGRIEGVGGRSVPRWAFEQTELRTDVFESRAFRTLGPWKMYRREMIERIGLRFPEDLTMGEDQPFVVHAYFNADGISILGDYDYIYLRNREDEQNMTLRHKAADANVDSLTRVLGIIAEYVEPGWKRDKLVTRMFLIEAMDSVLSRLPDEPDAEKRARVLSEAKGWVDGFYTARVADRLPEPYRFCFEAVRDADEADVIAALRSIEDGALFEPSQSLDDLSWEDGVFVARGRAGFSGLLAAPTVRMVLRRRNSQHVIRVEAEVSPPGTAGFSRYEVRVPVATVANGERITRGAWDTEVEWGFHRIRLTEGFGVDRSASIVSAPYDRTIPLPRWAYFKVFVSFDDETDALVLMAGHTVEWRERLGKESRKRYKRARKSLRRVARRVKRGVKRVLGQLTAGRGPGR